MLANIALSLFYYVRVLEPMYLRGGTGKKRQREPLLLHVVLLLIGLGTLVSGILPQLWVAFSVHAASLLAAALPR